MNLYRVGAGHVLLDYAHNPASYEAVLDMARRWPVALRTAVVSCPGDRSNVDLEMCGRTIGLGADRVAVKEDHDRRGRAPGETAHILASSIRAAAPDVPCAVELDERTCIYNVVAAIAPSELVLVFTDNGPGTVEILKDLGAVSVASIPNASGDTDAPTQSETRFRVRAARRTHAS
jgi:cyanophycin synthetase